jgi:hypothetical protein
MFGQHSEKTDEAEEWAYFGKWNAPSATTSDEDLLPGYLAISSKKGDRQLFDTEITVPYVNL